VVQYDWGTEGSGELGAADEELEHEHGELMESILQDEEEIIALHRQQIEDAMEIVRRCVAGCGAAGCAVFRGPARLFAAGPAPSPCMCRATSPPVCVCLCLFVFVFVCVCREMAMLQEVDQPGSSIDQYVDSLEAVLAQKMDGIRRLQLRLERFKGKLRQEDLMSRTVSKKHTTMQRT
jgi:hypothetical protein